MNGTPQNLRQPDPVKLDANHKTGLMAFGCGLTLFLIAALFGLPLSIALWKWALS